MPTAIAPIHAADAGVIQMPATAEPTQNTTASGAVTKMVRVTPWSARSTSIDAAEAGRWRTPRGSGCPRRSRRPLRVAADHPQFPARRRQRRRRTARLDQCAEHRPAHLHPPFLPHTQAPAIAVDSGAQECELSERERSPPGLVADSAVRRNEGCRQHDAHGNRDNRPPRNETSIRICAAERESRGTTSPPPRSAPRRTRPRRPATSTRVAVQGSHARASSPGRRTAQATSANTRVPMVTTMRTLAITSTTESMVLIIPSRRAPAPASGVVRSA